MAPSIRSRAGRVAIQVRPAVSLDLLKAIPLFSRVPADELTALRGAIEIVDYAKGQRIVTQDDAADAMYVIVSGRAKVFTSHESGRETILSILERGDFFGEMSLFDDQPRSASVEAIEACRALQIRKAVFLEMLKRSHEVAIALIGGLVRRLREADRKIENLALIDVYGRVARLLLDQAEEVGGSLVIRRPFKKTDIADMVGASREMVSRVMSDFEKRGYITTESSRIVILGKQLTGHARRPAYQ